MLCYVPLLQQIFVVVLNVLPVINVIWKSKIDYSEIFLSGNQKSPHSLSRIQTMTSVSLSLYPFPYILLSEQQHVPF